MTQGDSIMCPICSDPGAQMSKGGPGSSDRFSCPHCGEFFLTMQASLHTLKELPPNSVGKIRGWIYDRNRRGETDPPVLDSPTLREIAGSRPLPLVERPDRLLLEMVRDRPFPPPDLTMEEPGMMASAHIESENELVWLMEILVKAELVHWNKIEGLYSVTQDGYIRAEKLLRSPAISDQVFVAMWFADEMTPVWTDGFRVGIVRAGWRPYRVDEGHPEKKLDDEIVMQIRRSRMVVADFTGNRGGVYYEAGFCEGLERPVIWSCRKDKFETKEGPDVIHFDVRQFPFIVWETPAELADKVHKRIEARIGHGPHEG